MRLNYIDNVDCLQGMQSLPDMSVDMVCTDIPYGVCSRKDNGLRNLDKKNADVITFDLQCFLSEITRVVRGSVYVFLCIRTTL